MLSEWKNDGTFIKADTLYSSEAIELSKSVGPTVSENGNIVLVACATSPVTFGNNVSANCPLGQSSAVFALYHNPEFATPYVGIPEYNGPEPEVRLWPNPATDKITIESEEEFPVKSVAITDMQGQLLAILPVNDIRCTLNIRNLAPDTYIAHINTRAGNTDRKFVVGR